jgi:hypothetical protein
MLRRPSDEFWCGVMIVLGYIGTMIAIAHNVH